jgi:16S rRNA (uracil1498-N3)-methyltransferase
MSRERRFHVSDLDSETVRLSSEEAHHLVEVLRLREGAEVSLFDGKGGAARARVHRIAGGEVELRILGPERSRESPLSLTLAVAPPKGDRMSFLIEKLTELGVTRVIPLETERGRSGKSLERWRRIAAESCKQSGRSRSLEVAAPRSLEEVLHEQGRLMAAHPGAPSLSPPSATAAIVALIGPEGGWSEKELALAASRGATLFGLGPRTLRTETAAIAVATLLQYLAGDLSKEIQLQGDTGIGGDREINRFNRS